MYREPLDFVLQSPPVRHLINSLFSDKETALVTRTASYVIKLKDEPPDKNFRIILLPPHGFTANKINELLSYPEARWAKIAINGSVREGNQRFSRLKDVIKFCYYTQRKEEVQGYYPYALIDKFNSDYREEVKSTNETFFSVKESGEGFYHNIISLTDEWVVLTAYRELMRRKKMDIFEKITTLNQNEKNVVLQLIENIQKKGDVIFVESKDLVDTILKLPTEKVMPALINALNIYETGKHESCTVYAIILKMGKNDKANTLSFLQIALKQNDAPKYYLEELIEKLS